MPNIQNGGIFCMRRNAFLNVSLLVGVIWSSHSATAQEFDEAAKLVTPFRMCGQIAEREARLDCFDAALSGLDGSMENARLAAQAEQRAREEAERQARAERLERAKQASVNNFGLHEEDVKERTFAAIGEVEQNKRGDNAPESETEVILKAATPPDELTSTLISFSRNSLNKAVFILKNGQVWIETDVSRFRGRAKEGSEVVLEQGSLGGYRLKVVGKTGKALVKRLK